MKPFLTQSDAEAAGWTFAEVFDRNDAAGTPIYAKSASKPFPAVGPGPRSGVNA